MHFQIYQQVGGLLGAGQWRWRLVGANGEPIASGESYFNKADCLHAIQLVKGTSGLTPVIEVNG